MKGTGNKFIKEKEDCFINYYYCNRSGKQRKNSTGKKRTKLQGSSKQGTHCTASMVVAVPKHNGGEVRLKMCKTHYGHQLSIGHLRLQTSLRQSIAGQLAQGVTFQHILDEIRDSVSVRFERIHLITRKDIANIERSFGLSGSERHKDDATSVSMWVEEMKSKECVLLYKPQGEQSEACHTLLPNDFILAIQTNLQAEMLKKFGPGKVVCIDATHGTNGYDFSLITLIVIDEFGEGYPVAWCISNTTDLTLLLHFYSAVKKRVGSINPRWLMTDDAEQFYTAWYSIFKGAPQKLLCTWHVDRAWRGQLKSIKDKHLAQKIYHNLRVLMEESDESKFNHLLNETQKQLSLSADTKGFSVYFDTHYVRRKQQWAGCYRKSSFINTNMYVEAFHRVLKHVYMKGKVNKRVDKCIHILMKYDRDKAFERLVKLEKGKTSGRITTIMKRHTVSKTLSPTLVASVEENTWTIRSSETNQHYTVVRESENCPFGCAIICTECKICIHMYCCNCADALLHHTICKHIHLVAAMSYTSTEFISDHHVNTQDQSTCNTDSETLLSVLQCNIQSDIESTKERLLRRISTVNKLYML